MLVAEVLSRLRSMQNPQAVAALAKQGIVPRAALGLSNGQLRQVAEDIGIDRLIAQQLWASGIHDARVLASLVDDPARVTPKQMERWVRDFDNWALCDACCFNLFDKTPFAYAKAVAWSARKEEYVKRAAFSLVAALAAQDRKAPDSEFLRFFPIIRREAADERPLVRKAVASALKEMGRRNRSLRKLVAETVKDLDQMEAKSAHWIAMDVLKDLSAPAKSSASRKPAASKKPKAKKAPAARKAKTASKRR
jgi:3-methyladenine DNA glycosylase AlkD